MIMLTVEGGHRGIGRGTCPPTTSATTSPARRCPAGVHMETTTGGSGNGHSTHIAGMTPMMIGIGGSRRRTIRASRRSAGCTRRSGDRMQRIGRAHCGSRPGSASGLVGSEERVAGPGPRGVAVGTGRPRTGEPGRDGATGKEKSPDGMPGLAYFRGRFSRATGGRAEALCGLAKSVQRDAAAIGLSSR